MGNRIKYKMNKTEFKKKWIKALRSGEYEQGVGKLCQTHDDGENYEYCCLGVAYEVMHGEDAWEPAKLLFRRKSSGKLLQTAEGGDSHWEPPWVCPKIVGPLDGAGCAYWTVNQWSDFAMLNDDERLTFNEIADLLEKYWK